MLLPMPRIRVPRPFAAALGLMLFVSCTNPAGMCGCPPAAAEAVVYGRVTNPAGAGVSGAHVSFEMRVNQCDPATAGVIGGVLSGTDGRYRIHLRGGGIPLPGSCLRAYANPPTAALRTSDTVTVEVEFAYEEVVDSAQVDLVLRAP